jgi:hypothetical protein
MRRITRNRAWKNADFYTGIYAIKRGLLVFSQGVVISCPLDRTGIVEFGKKEKYPQRL